MDVSILSFDRTNENRLAKQTQAYAFPMSETAASTFSKLTISLYKKVYTYRLHFYFLYPFLRPLLICFHIEDLINRPISFIRQPS